MTTANTLFLARPSGRRPSGERGLSALVVIGVLATVGAVTSAAVWTMHLTAHGRPVPEFSKAVEATDRAQAPAAGVALQRMFGAPAAGADVAVRDMQGIQLQGIVGNSRGAGVALFSIDGGPPVRVKVDGYVRDGVKLIEIRPRQVVLERNGRPVELALVKPAPGNAGTAPSGAVPARVPR